MTEVKKYLETTSNLVDTIEFVATEWNPTEQGDLVRNINKCYQTDVKNIPKTDLYYVDIKPKSTPVKKASIGLSKVQETSAVDTTDKNICQDEEVAESSKHEDDVDNTIKKKKKKKKTKTKDASLE